LRFKSQIFFCKFLAFFSGAGVSGYVELELELWSCRFPSKSLKGFALLEPSLNTSPTQQNTKQKPLKTINKTLCKSIF